MCSKDAQKTQHNINTKDKVQIICCDELKIQFIVYEFQNSSIHLWTAIFCITDKG